MHLSNKLRSTTSSFLIRRRIILRYTSSTSSSSSSSIIGPTTRHNNNNNNNNNGASTLASISYCSRYCHRPAVTTCTTPTTTTTTTRGFLSGTIPPPSDDKDPSSSSKHDNSQQKQQQHKIHHTNIPETNQAYQDRLEIRQTLSLSSDIEWGVFAKRDFAVGDWVMSTHVLDITPQADMHTIQLDQRTHAHIDLPARLLNHYCNQANVGVVVTTTTTTTTTTTMREEDGVAETTATAAAAAAASNHTFDFYAIRPIQQEQELFFDYATTEFELSSPFDCSCGSPDCRGKLTGFQDHADQVIAAYQEQFIAPYLVQWFRDNRKG